METLKSKLFRKKFRQKTNFLGNLKIDLKILR